MSTKVESAQPQGERIERRALRALHANFRANMGIQDGALLDQFSELLSQVADVVKAESFKADLKAEKKSADNQKQDPAASKQAGQETQAAADPTCVIVRQPVDPKEFHTKEQDSDEDSDDQEVPKQVEGEESEQATNEPVVKEVPESEQPQCPVAVDEQLSTTQLETEASQLTTQSTELPKVVEQEVSAVEMPQTGKTPAEIVKNKEQSSQELPLQSEVATSQVQAAESAAPSVAEQVVVVAKPEAKVEVEQKAVVNGAENRVAQQATQVQQDIALRDPNTDQFELHQQIAEKLIEHIQEKLAKTDASAATLTQRAQPFNELREVLAIGVSAEGFLTSQLKSSSIASNSNLLSTPEIGRAKGLEGIKPAQNNNAQLNNGFAQKAAASAEPQGESVKSSKQSARAEIQKSLERVQATIKEVERSKDGKTISLRLDPPNLGTVKVDVSYRDANLHARIIAEAPKVAQLLRDKVGEIQQMLRDAGINADSVSVSVGGGSSSQEQAWSGAGKEGAHAQKGFSNILGANSTNLIGTMTGQGRKEVVDDHWVA